jgi:hypothetical protein
MGRHPRLTMKNQNPYAAPQADVADVVQAEAVDIRRMNRVASAQKFVIYSLLAALAATGIRSLVGSEVGLLLGVLVTILMMVGAVRLDGALNGSILSRILYALTMLLPLISLIIMFTLSLRASKELKAAGYKVGLLGADARSDPS